MKRENVKTIIVYYYGIPEMKKLLQQEKNELEDKYNALGGFNMDGMPHGHTPGSPAENLAIKLADDRVSERIRAIEKTLETLQADTETITAAMDAISGRYKKLLSMRYQCNYSWAKISVQLEVPDSTARNWNDKALERLGEAITEKRKSRELLKRAARARI